MQNNVRESIKEKSSIQPQNNKTLRAPKSYEKKSQKLSKRAIPQDFQPILQDFQPILQAFQAILQDFQTILQDFKVILQDFQAILKEF